MVVPWLCDEQGKELDDQQRELAASDDAHVLINAGPGSGKTRVLVAHYLHLLITRSDFDVENVIAITFTEKAATEMKDRITKILQRTVQVMEDQKYRQRARDLLDRLPEAPIGTIHSFCARLLRRFALEAGIDPSFRILDELQAQTLRREVSERWLWQQIIDAKTSHHSEAQIVVAHWGFERAARILSDLLAKRLLIEHRKANGKPLLCRIGELTKAEQALESCYKAVAASYDDAKAFRCALDFDDLLLQTWWLLGENEAVRQQVRKTHFRILLDESQDTDRVQVEIVRLLCGWEENGRRGFNSDIKFFGVGDSQQSIYGFRNADVSMFNKLWQDAREKYGWRTERLRDNYRSIKPLVELTNHTFERIFVISEKADEQERLFRTSLQPMGFVRDETAKLPPLELAFFKFPDNASKWQKLCWEADWIARRIAELNRDSVTFKDTVILLRELINVSVYEDALRRYGIPYHIIAGYGFFETMEARDLLSFLQIIAEPDDPVALAAWLRSPMVGVSDETLFCVQECKRAGTQWSEKGNLALDIGSLNIAENERRNLQRAAELLAQAQDMTDRKSVRELLEWLINETRYDAIVAALPHGRQRLANIRKFVRMAQEISERLKLNVRGLVRYAKALVEGEVRIGEPPLAGAVADAVQIMTIHAAKGLEFPVVIVPMLGEVNAPRGSGEDLVADPDNGIAVRVLSDTGESLGRNDERMKRFIAVDERRILRERAEAERLLFVAWTRAKERLILVGCGSKQSLQPSKDGSWSNWLQLISDTLQVPVGKTTDEFAIGDGRLKVCGEEVTQEKLQKQARRAAFEQTLGEKWLQQPETIPKLQKPDFDLPKLEPPVVRLSVTDLLLDRFVVSCEAKEEWSSSIDGTKLPSIPDYEPSGLTPIELGLIVHHLLRYRITEPNEVQLRWIAQAVNADADATVAQLDAIREFVRKAEKSQVWQQAMKAEQRWHELDFRVRLDGEPPVELIGRWDLICYSLSGWLIIDFKTDKIATQVEAEQDFEESYLLQAKAYAYAVHKVFGAEQVQVTFVFLAADPPLEVHRKFCDFDTLSKELLERAQDFLREKSTP